MARQSENFVCQSCGAVYGKWQGRCDACGEWNAIIAEPVEAGPPGSAGAARGARGKALEFSSLKGGGEFEPRLLTGNAEFDRACGGGLVPGSALLIGGDPGVGKSTLLLQVAAGLASGGTRIAYISGEEATAREVNVFAIPDGLEFCRAIAFTNSYATSAAALTWRRACSICSRR